MSPEVCRTCKAPIVWAITDNGRLMPIDAQPNPTGNLQLDSSDGPLRATVVPAEHRVQFFGELHVSHFATCPHADAHRR